tara:strand:+ start:13907 stop:14074 length:168 start_codon:yes stop_codon:yes gene_type:complete
MYSANKTPSDIFVCIAKNVAVLRKENDWMQQDLADTPDVSYGSIKRFETSGKISF